MRQTGAPLQLDEARQATQSGERRAPVEQAHRRRVFVERLLEPGQRLFLLAERGVDDGQVELPDIAPRRCRLQ